MILVDTTAIIDMWRWKLSIKSRLELYPDKIFGISAIMIEEIYDGVGLFNQNVISLRVGMLKQKHLKCIKKLG